MPSLKDMKWPSSPLKAKDLDENQLKQFLQIRAFYEKSAFVNEGHVEVRTLGPKEFTEPIPPGESAISALAVHTNGKIYGGTGGQKSHLFFYDPTPDADVVVGIGIVAENARVTSLVSCEDGNVYGATESLDGGSGVIFQYKPCETLLKEADFKGLGAREIFDMSAEDQVFFSIVDPCHSAGKIETIISPLQGEGISDIVIDNERKIIYGVSSQTGTLFKFDISTKEVSSIGRIDANGNFSQKLLILPDGNLYGAGLYGRLFKLNAESGSMRFLDACAPALKGRELYNRVTNWIYDKDKQLIYGGTVDGIVFRYDLHNDKMTCIGKPIDQSLIRALTLGNEGTVYGICGEKGKCCHMFIYNDESRELKDMGVLLARVERPWYGYEISCAATGADGRIYYGEEDRISNLFMYFPPVKKILRQYNFS